MTGEEIALGFSETKQPVAGPLIELAGARGKISNWSHGVGFFVLFCFTQSGSHL